MFDPRAVLSKFECNAAAPSVDFKIIERGFGVQLPDDYVTFMRANDGGEGFVGSQYLILWRASELAEFNRDYEVSTYAPGLVLFGSNGGGEGFAFDARHREAMKIRIVPFIGMSLADAKAVADTFSSFLQRLAEDNGPIL